MSSSSRSRPSSSSSSSCDYCGSDSSSSRSRPSSSSSSSCDYCGSDSSSSRSRPSSSSDGESYCSENCLPTLEADFVVVGMGAAGATVLRYLSDAGFSVIGIEAGGNYDNDPHIYDATYAPELEHELSANYFWQQSSTPNENIMNSEGEHVVMNYTTGRLLGGGSSINGMQYVRSDDIFWGQWANINGLLWNPSAVSNGFKDLEKFVGASPSGSDKFDPSNHGTDGMMQIRQAPVFETDLALDFAIGLANATGTTIIEDYNDPSTPVGTFTRWSLFQQPNGNRASSSTNFLSDIVDENGDSRSNRDVKIMQNTTANKVLFTGNVASGLTVIQNGHEKLVKAHKEIILAAGIHSNSILQRSGVGDQSILASMGIPVIFNNPAVGRNSENHLINIAVFSAPPSYSPGTGSDPNSLYVGGGFIPDASGGPFNERGFQWIGVDGGPGILVVIFYDLNPKSLGTNTIQDKDPLRVSLFSENLYSDPADLQRTVDVYRNHLLGLANELQSINSEYQLLNPPMSFLTNSDPTDLEQFIKDNLDHAHHWTGTCAMRPLNQDGVVDNEGKVYGTRKLRVADISVAPIQPSGNTAGPAIFVGYNIAKQLIIEHGN